MTVRHVCNDCDCDVSDDGACDCPTDLQELAPVDPSILTPGIRATVLWLRENGFDTVDSGDGVTNPAAGMEMALTVPHVYIRLSTSSMIEEADRLWALLRERGIDLSAPTTLEEAMVTDVPDVTARYCPRDGRAFLELWHVDDALLARRP